MFERVNISVFCVFVYDVHILTEFILFYDSDLTLYSVLMFWDLEKKWKVDSLNCCDSRKFQSYLSYLCEESQKYRFIFYQSRRYNVADTWTPGSRRTSKSLHNKANADALAACGRFNIKMLSYQYSNYNCKDLLPLS